MPWFTSYLRLSIGDLRATDWLTAGRVDLDFFFFESIGLRIYRWFLVVVGILTLKGTFGDREPLWSRLMVTLSDSLKVACGSIV